MTKESKIRLTDKIIITFEGNNLPREVKLYRGTIRLRIIPFMESVRQCYGYFQFGHQKRLCRVYKKCVVCGESFHGECNKEPKCVNCGEKHWPNSKKCPEYEYNFQLKRYMVERNVSIYEAMKVVNKPMARRDLGHQCLWLRICNLPELLGEGEGGSSHVRPCHALPDTWGPSILAIIDQESCEEDVAG